MRRSAALAAALLVAALAALPVAGAVRAQTAAATTTATTTTATTTTSVPARPPYRGALDLWKAGYRDEARAEARRVATEVATEEEIPEVLEAPGEGWRERFDRWLDLASSAVPVALLALLLLALPGLAVARRFRRPRVVMDKFGDSSDQALGPTLKAMLVDEIQSAGTGYSLELVRDAAASPDLELATVLGDRWRWLVVIVAQLSTRPEVTVRCETFVLSQGEPGTTCAPTEVRLTVSIARGRKAVANRSFAAQRPGVLPLDLLSSVVPLAAAWVADQLAPRERAAPGVRLGTANWRSWGAFRQGVWYHQHRDLDQARVHYLDAVSIDVNNVGAWVNLASLDIRDQEGWDLALDRLNVVDSLVPPGKRPRSAVWFRVLNLRAITLLHRARQPGDNEAARDAAFELVRNIARAELELEEDHRGPFSRRNNPEEEDLHQVVTSTETTAVTLLASTLVHLGQEPGLSPSPAGSRPECLARLRDLDAAGLHVDEVLGLLLGLRKSVLLPGPAHYNLACLYARAFAGAPAADAAKRAKFVDCMLGYLGRGLEAAPDLVAWARTEDPSFTGVRNDPAAAERFYAYLDRIGPLAAGAAEAPPDVDGWRLIVPRAAASS